MSTEPSESLVIVPNSNNEDDNSSSTSSMSQRQQQQAPFDPNQMNNLFFWAIRNSDPEKLKQLTESADPNKTRERAKIFFGNNDNDGGDANGTTTAAAASSETTTTATNKRRAIDPIQVIKEQIAILSKSQTDRERESISNEDRFYSLIRLQDFIDKIDFANDFHKLNGTNVMLNIVNEFLQMDTFNEEVYTIALEALENLATCLHNNAWLQTQDQYQRQVFPFVIETLNSSKLNGSGYSRMKEKLVSILSALCSNQPVSLMRFLELSGVRELVVPLIRKNCQSPSAESNKLSSKLMFLLFNLMICEEELPQKTNLAASILSHFDSLIIQLLETHKSMNEESEIDLVEKTLLVLRDLAMAEHVKSEYQKMAKSGKLQPLLKEILENAQSKEDADRFYDVKDYIGEINSY